MGWLESFLQSIVDFTATLDPRMALLLLVICAIGEAGLTVPLLLETIWMTVGLNYSTGVLSFWHLLGLWFAAQIGRQIGAVVLYNVGRLGMPALNKLYHKVHLDKLFDRLMSKAGAVNKINLASPFSVAFGRLVGMRIPMTLVLAAKKKPFMLAIGVFMASIIFDGLFITVGIILGKIEVKPAYTVLITVGVLAVIYLITFLVTFIIKRRKQTDQPADEQ
jgi:membrane protein DedA with SNARE-associated domain